MSLQDQPRLFSIGHSNRTIEAFIALLESHGIEAIADIRRFPGSRVHPQFNREQLSASVAARGIEYHWFEDLGGRRHGPAQTASQNSGLELPAFRAYADYMSSPQFQAAVDRLLVLARKVPTAFMCAEKLFWKCHRRLLSDYLVGRGVEVGHIVEGETVTLHALSEGAVARADGLVVYPARQPELFPGENGIIRQAAD